VTPGRRFGLGDVLDRSIRSDDVPIELGSLGWWSWLATGLAVLVAVGHRTALRLVVELPDPVAEFLVRCGTVWGLDRWGPWVAGVVAVALGACAVATGGFRRGGFRVLAAIAVLDVTAALLAVPVALSVAAGLAAIAVMVAIGVAALAVVGMLLFGSSGD